MGHEGPRSPAVLRYLHERSQGFAPGVHSAADEVGVEVADEGVAVEVAHGDGGGVVEDDMVAADFDDFVEVDHVGAVDAHEDAGGQAFLDALHGEEGHDGALLAYEVETEVGPHGLDVADVAHAHAHHLVVGLEEDVVGLGERSCLVGGLSVGCGGDGILQLVLAAHLFGRLAELVHGEGLEQIVHGVGAEAFDGIFAVGRGEHHEGRREEGTHEVEAVEVGHVDVDEDGIDGLVLEHTTGFHGACGGADELEIGNLLDAGGELLECQGLVVDG